MIEYIYLEVFKDIFSFEGFYKISNFSRVKSLERYVKHSKGGLQIVKEKILKPDFSNKDGRLYIHLSKNGIVKTCSVHRLVLETFIGPCPEGMEACHNDGNALNNKLENLRWDTPKNNQADRIKHGTDCRGEKCSNSILTWKKVEEIREKYVPRKYTLQMLGNEYNVEFQQISRIINNKEWTV